MGTILLNPGDTIAVCDTIWVKAMDDAAPVPNVANMSDFWCFVRESLFDWTFLVGLAFILLAIFVIKLSSYRLLISFKKSPASYKITAIVAFLTLFVVVSNIPHIEAQNYGIWFALPVMVLAFASCVVFSAISGFFRMEKRQQQDNPIVPETSRRQRNLLLMAKFMLWVWSFGWVVYFIAISIGKQPHVGAEVLLRSALCSIQLFAANMDGDVIFAIADHDILKGLISSACFAATLCTFILIMSLVLSRLIAYLHIRHLSIDKQRNHVYLFFGMNDASKLLAKDICLNSGDPNGVVIFVETSLAGETEKDENKTGGWNSVLSMLTHRRKTFLDVPDDDRHALAIASCSLCNIDGETTDVWTSIGLTTVKESLEKLKSIKDKDAELQIFLLSEDRDANVRSVPILAKDNLVACPDYRTVIYCHARRNGVNRIVEDLGLANESRTEVRIIDSSHLAIEQLKSKVMNHPIEFVSVNPLSSKNPGTVSSPFIGLVMGLGETGEEAVKFLYEYGAFVDEKASATNSFRSPFCCHVVDKDMKCLEGHFVSEVPGAVCQKSNKNKDDALIKLYPYDYSSDAFFTEVLGKIADSLNYVVIAIGDDEQNMTVAVEILRYVRSKRANLDNFRIYVRAYEKGSFKHMNEIANHYNQRLGKDRNDLSETIVPFGQSESIYTYELVVRDKFELEGRQYYETYRSLQIAPENDEGTWEERHRKNMKPDGTTTKWDRMSKIRRKESQDRSNALHAKTKIRLLEKAIGEEKAKDLALKALGNREKKKGAIHYQTLSPEENKLMLNLAMCEHLRWNASHEMMGYVNNESGHSCNERMRQHNCLKPWQELDKESKAADYIDDYKVFDYGVVETSFKLEYKL